MVVTAFYSLAQFFPNVLHMIIGHLYILDHATLTVFSRVYDMFRINLYQKLTIFSEKIYCSIVALVIYELYLQNIFEFSNRNMKMKLESSCKCKPKSTNTSYKCSKILLANIISPSCKQGFKSSSNQCNLFTSLSLLTKFEGIIFLM